MPSRSPTKDAENVAGCNSLPGSYPRPLHVLDKTKTHQQWGLLLTLRVPVQCRDSWRRQWRRNACSHCRPWQQGNQCLLTLFSIIDIHLARGAATRAVNLIQTNYNSVGMWMHQWRRLMGQIQQALLPYIRWSYTYCLYVMSSTSTWGITELFPLNPIPTGLLPHSRSLWTGGTGPWPRGVLLSGPLSCLSLPWKPWQPCLPLNNPNNSWL